MQAVWSRNPISDHSKMKSRKQSSSRPAEESHTRSIRSVSTSVQLSVELVHRALSLQAGILQADVVWEGLSQLLTSAFNIGDAMHGFESTGDIQTEDASGT